MSERRRRGPTLSEAGRGEREARRSRLAEALRANLKKRKDQARARGAGEAAGAPQPAPPPGSRRRRRTP